MMRPHLRSRIPGSTAFVVWKAADKLSAISMSHFSSGKLSKRRDELHAGVIDQNIDGAKLLRRPAP